MVLEGTLHSTHRVSRDGSGVPKKRPPSRLSAARSPGDLEVFPDNNPGDRETLKCVCEDVFCGGTDPEL